MLGYKYDLQASYASSYKYDCWCHYNSAYKYKQKFILDKDYKAERKSIWGYVGKNETKPPLVQEFKRKTLPACKSVQEPPSTPAPLALAPLAPTFFTPASFAPALASQKSKSNLLDRQECLALAAKNPEYQALNPDTSSKKV